MQKSEKRLFKSWMDEIKRLCKIMYPNMHITDTGAAMFEFWFDHGYTEGRVTQLVAEWDMLSVNTITHTCPVQY